MTRTAQSPHKPHLTIILSLNALGDFCEKNTNHDECIFLDPILHLLDEDEEYMDEIDFENAARHKDSIDALCVRRAFDIAKRHDKHVVIQEPYFFKKMHAFSSPSLCLHQFHDVMFEIEQLLFGVCDKNCFTILV